MGARRLAMLALLAAVAVAGAASGAADRGPADLTLRSARATARVGSDGAELELDGRRAGLALARVGRDGSERSVGSASPTRRGELVELEHGSGVTEWWRQVRGGFEHGVTLAGRPAGGGLLVLEVALEGARAEPIDDRGVRLVDAGGGTVGTYRGLLVVDAEGGEVPARMVATGPLVRIEVDDARARYPIVVDPLVGVEEATLLAEDPDGGDRFGTAVAISGDGSIALAGAPTDYPAGTRTGSARIWTRTGTTWAPGPTLTPPAGAVDDNFGAALALAADGTRAIVGAQRDDTASGVDAGTAFVFVGTGSAWSIEATLATADARTTDLLGSAIALSADGSIALVGAPSDDVGAATNAGTARAFARSGTTWAETATLVASDAATADQLGGAVALSADGSRALVGVPSDDTGAGVTGSARVFARAGSSWTEEATLVPADAATGDRVGAAVALSADGSLALVGADSDDGAGAVSNTGSARVFSRSGTIWSEVTSLVTPDAAAADQCGRSVGLSADGTRAVVGCMGDDVVVGASSIANAGTLRVFSRSGTTWTYDSALVAPDTSASDQLGNAAAIAGDGLRAIAGAPQDDPAGGSPLDTGSARVFTIEPSHPDGSACTTGLLCTSGFCVDGACCNSACGGSATDCQACSVSAGGTVDGTCGALSASAATATVCRSAVGPCDAAETCDAASTVCPTDGRLAAGTVCATTTNPCRLDARCSGTGTTCPSFPLAPAGTICRSPSLPCEDFARCDGSGACPTYGTFLMPFDGPPAATGTVCRASAGACDVAEVCDGTVRTCPGDALLPPGNVCRPSGGDCDVAETCSGASAACPTDVVVASGTTCRASAGICDQAEICDGTSPACAANAFASAGTTCAASSGEVCDAPDVCTGTSADCMPTFLSGVECRASAGGCDPAEVCAGSATTCPPDQIEPAGMTCRASTDPTCDPSEACDGAAAACPADVTSCVASDAGAADGGAGTDGGASDAGRTDGGAGSVDAATLPTDAALPPAAAAGCACRARGGTSAPVVGLAAGLAAWWLLRRR